MAECRAHVDERNSFFPSGGSLRAESGKDLLMKAVTAVVSGDLAPRQMLSCLPDPVRPVLDVLPRRRHGGPVKTERTVPASSVSKLSPAAPAHATSFPARSRRRFLWTTVALALLAGGAMTLWWWLA